MNASAYSEDQMLVKLAEMGIVRELTGQKHGRVFCYSGYLELLNRETV